ncbi:MAG: sulfate ABC transporter permease subunit CysT [Deltaproteobacteria bacterium]|nr:sulfate ABC transporter permease subunit CysT [Deltaproteobacteria bacterium]
MKGRGKRRHLATGRYLVRSIAAAFLILMIGLPIASIVAVTFEDGPVAAWRALTSPVALSALWLTAWTATVVTVINAVLGTLTAWVLTRYRFPGRALLSSMIDLPFAIPTIVTGLMLVVLYGPQNLVGAWFEQGGFRVLFAPPGIILALLFVTFPLVVRAVEPVLMEIEQEQEQAAFTLGAWPLTTFRLVILPAIAPAVLTGSLMTFVRALGEFGSVVIVAGNLPRRTLTAPVYVFGAIESGEAHAASAMSSLLVAVSLVTIMGVDRFARARKEKRGLT